MKHKKFVNRLASLVDEAREKETKGSKHITRQEIADELRGTSFLVMPPMPAADDADMRKALRRAGEQFLDYEAHHIAKNTDDGMKKAGVNRDMAIMCFDAIGEPVPAMVDPKFADWKIDVHAESAPGASREPQERDSAAPAPGSATTDAQALLRMIHEAVQKDAPYRNVDFQPDTQIVVKTLVSVGFATLDDVSDLLGITAAGREWLGIRPEGTIALPVEVAEVTGNIDERELAARYMEGKVAAIDKAIRNREAPKYEMSCSWEESYQHCAITLAEAAKEFRQGLHIPAVHIDGRVIPYNDDRGTGIQHRVSLGRFFDDVYQRNVKAGWWTNIEDGTPKKRNVGELMVLMVTEMAEAYEAYISGSADDKLPQYPGLGVEMGDLAIRLADFCGALAAGNLVGPSETNNPGEEMFLEIVEIAKRYEAIRKTPEAKGDPEMGDHLPAQDVATMIDAKLDFNATRADHKIENRLKEGGKQT